MMPYDSELNRLEGNLTELAEEINLLDMFQRRIEPEVNRVIILNRTLARLTGLKELAEMKIKVHKERVKESGVKIGDKVRILDNAFGESDDPDDFVYRGMFGIVRYINGDAIEVQTDDDEFLPLTIDEVEVIKE